VFLSVAFPVEDGFVQSLAHPGGNMTGITSEATTETNGKTLQILKEIVPNLKRAALSGLGFGVEGSADGCRRRRLAVAGEIPASDRRRSVGVATGANWSRAVESDRWGGPEPGLAAGFEGLDNDRTPAAAGTSAPLFAFVTTIGRLIAAARPRVSCRTTSSPAASAMATEASALPPSTASTSAGGGSSAASERNSRGSPAASFSTGMTMATPVIAFGSLQQPGPSAPGRPAGRGRRDVPARRENREEFSKQEAGAEGITKQDVIPAVSDFLTSLALIMAGPVACITTLAQTTFASTASGGSTIMVFTFWANEASARNISFGGALRAASRSNVRIRSSHPNSTRSVPARKFYQNSSGSRDH
jgi:hypothetical protein